MSNEHEWWASAPTWAQWHTWDKLGKTWWQKRPKNYNGRWCHGNEDNLGKWNDYDSTPCPVEIDPNKTLRKRPKGEQDE